MRKLLSVIFVILLSTTMSAQSSGGHIVRPIQKTIQEKAIVVDGMKYKIKGNRATLIKGKDSPIISIPQYINCNGSKILVTSIGPDAFQSYKNITTVTIPNSVTSIGDHVFCNYNGLNSLVISKSVKEIGGDNFYGCRENLNYIKVETGNPNYNSRNNCNAIIETATNKLILGCKNSTIPTGLVTIGAGSFSGCRKLSAITIPNSVSAIENGAFSSCSSLTSIAIPSSVKTIGQMAFSWCTALTSINIPNSVRYIGYLAFENCGFNQVRIPKETKLHSFDGEQKQRVFNDNVKIIRY